jgi:hypothetical protein
LWSDVDDELELLESLPGGTRKSRKAEALVQVMRLSYYDAWGRCSMTDGWMVQEATMAACKPKF